MGCSGGESAVTEDVVGGRGKGSGASRGRRRRRRRSLRNRGSGGRSIRRDRGCRVRA